MTIHELTWIKLTQAALEALVNRDLQQASTLIGVQLDSFFSTDDAVWLWDIRLNQARQDPRSLDWIAQVVTSNQQVVGHAGFHGPPDQMGMVEVAYSVVPAQRGQGYAKAMLHDLLYRARAEKEVQIVRATISPDNAASLATIRPFGFTYKGQQLDDMDGIEYIFELDSQSLQIEID
ncbi:GNAT family N-acetyltransferase [Siphonobacter curvatus]|uniref:GNAT family N-acetyltransferase n=1 Tax=Siphonobacter curvatus TaxID=2094562 RepID=A0A2S7IFA3_9BACT|nr:GNAT family N-acetyltransferase [Siphonobacter curvatus]PQA53373.1 GNAT family N-acetyltransferase [Siphonobacter curvatus]